MNWSNYHSQKVECSMKTSGLRLLMILGYLHTMEWIQLCLRIEGVTFFVYAPFSILFRGFQELERIKT